MKAKPTDPNSSGFELAKRSVRNQYTGFLQSEMYYKPVEPAPTQQPDTQSWWQKALEFSRQTLGVAIQSVDRGLMPATGVAAASASTGVALNQGGQAAQQSAYENVFAASEQANAQKSGGLGTGPLSIAAGAADWAWSKAIAQPASTATLLATPGSPLYQDGSVEQIVGYFPDGKPIIKTVPTQAGFQLDDIGTAWNRAENVSFGQAVTANPSLLGAGPFGIGVRLFGLDSYDPWSVEDMASAQENPFYKAMTGTLDASLQMIVPPELKVARLAAMRRLGLSNTVRSADDLAGMRTAWDAWKTGAPEGRANNPYGQLVQDLVDETDPVKIRKLNPLVANAAGVDKGRLSHILAKTTDGDTANEIVLASRGDVTALQRLQEAVPDHVWQLAHMNETVQNAWINGRRLMPEGEAAARLEQTFKTANDRNEYFSMLREMFTSGPGETFVGSTWKPTMPVLRNGKPWDPLANWMSKQATSTVEQVRRGGRATGYAIRESDYSAGPQWLHEASSSRYGEPVTRFMHWVGSRMPLGFVSRSSLRPNDLWIELDAGFSRVPMLSGTQPLNIGRELDPATGKFVDVFMTPAEYRNWLTRRISDGYTNGQLLGSWQAAEDHVVATMARTLGIDPDKAALVVAGYRNAADESLGYLQRQGYLYDDQAQQIRLSPDSRSMLLDAYATLDLGEIYRGLQGELGWGIRASQTADDAAEWLFDQGSKFFRVNVLFKPGYIPRNSVAEPLLSSFLAHGTILTDEGLAATIGNFGRNRANDLARVRYAIDLNNRIKRMVQLKVPRSERKQVARELRALVQQRREREMVIADYTALLDDIKAGKTISPSSVREYQDEVEGRLVEAQLEMESIDAALDGRLPEWRQIVAPASLPDVAVRLRELRALAGRDMSYITDLRQERDDILAAAKSRGAAGRSAELSVSERSRLKYLDSTIASVERVLPAMSLSDAERRLRQLDAEADDYVRAQLDVIETQYRRVDAKQLELQNQINELPSEAKDSAPQWEEIRRLRAEMDDLREQRKDVTRNGAARFLNQNAEEISRLRQVQARKWETTESPANRYILDRDRQDAEKMLGPDAEWPGGEVPWADLYNRRRDIVVKKYGVEPDTDAFDRAYLKEFYPDLSLDDEITLYRGLTSMGGSARNVFSGWENGTELTPGKFAHWSLNPAVGNNFGRVGAGAAASGITPGTTGKVAVLRVKIRDLMDMTPATGRESGFPFLPGYHRSGDFAGESKILLDYTKIPENVKASVRVFDANANVPAGYAQGLRMSADEILKPQTVVDDTYKSLDQDLIKRIDELQATYDDIVASYDRPVYSPEREIERLNREIEMLDSRIRGARVRQGIEVGKRESVSGVRSYRGSGNDFMYVYVGNHRIAVPAAFSDRALDFGPGYRAEASAAMTSAQTWDPSFYVSNRQLRYRVKSKDSRRVDVDSEDYWPELAHSVNVYFRNDPLIQRIMQAPDGDELRLAREWLRTPEGVRYQKSMGRDYLALKETRAPARPLKRVKDSEPSTVGVRTVLRDSTSDLMDVVRIVKQYLPDPKVRQIVAAREVDASELQRLMGARDDLKAVVGDDVVFDTNTLGRIGRGINKSMDAVWQFMTSHFEDRIARWPFFNREFKIQLQRRIDILKSQGVDVGENEIHALRQASARAAIEQLEKTFYNIRRYSSPVYAARFLTAFPGAFANSIYRYGRFAVNEPERMTQALLVYGNILENAGVDENGNPVGRDIRKAKFIIVPGTKRSDTDRGIRVPVASIEAMTVGLPGLSWLAMYSVSKMVESNPSNEELIQNALGPVGFKVAFPYGIPRDPASTVISSYQRDLIANAQGVNNDDFMRIAIETFADDYAQWERNGGNGPAPTFDEAVSSTRSFLFTRAAIKANNPVGTDQQEPGQVMRDAWYAVQAKYGPARQDEARKYYMKQYGDWSRWYTYSSRQYQAYIPSTQQAYERVWVKYPALTQKIVSLKSDDPSLVSLLTIGTGGEFSPAVSNFLLKNPLPGDSVPVTNRLTTEQFFNKVQINDGWAWYLGNKAKYDAERDRLAALRDKATTKYDQAYYRQWIKTVDASWDDAVAKYSDSNLPWAMERTDPSGSRATQAAMVLTTILKDPAFMAQDGKSATWQRIDSFLGARLSAKEAIANADSSDYKTEIKRSFYEYAMKESQADPDFAAMFDRYFASEWTDVNQ